MSYKVNEENKTMWDKTKWDAIRIDKTRQDEVRPNLKRAEKKDTNLNMMTKYKMRIDNRTRHGDVRLEKLENAWKDKWPFSKSTFDSLLRN